MNMKLTGVGVILLLSVAACAKPKSNTISQQDFIDLQNVYTEIEDLAVDTNPADMPDSGTATYNGYMTGSPSSDVDVVAELEITADFDAGTLDGSATNVNLLADASSDLETQVLTGTLDVTGSFAGTVMTADVTGDLGGSVQGFDATFVTDVGLEGDFMSSDPLGTDSDIMLGYVTGDVDLYVAGSFEDSMTFDPGEGEFVVCTVDCDTLIP